MPRPENDPNSKDEDALWRRLRPSWIVEEEDGTRRISSAAFWHDGDMGEISVNVGRLTDTVTVLRGYPNDTLGSVVAAYPRRELDFTVALEDEPDNPGHAHLYPPDGMTVSARKCAGGKMARQAIIIVQR